MRLWKKLGMLLAVLSGALGCQGETYVTPRHVSIDRCASAWFIKRFIDPDAVFVFFVQGEKPPPGIGFAFYGAPYFNRGPDCTFTDLVKKHQMQTNAALQKINAIANDVKSWMQGPGTTSARLNNHIADLYELAKSDSAVFEAVFPTLDLLYVKCGGHREGYLAPQRKYYDLLELQLLRQSLNKKGRERIDRLFDVAVGTSMRPPDSALLNSLGIEARSSDVGSKADAVEDIVRALNGEVSAVGSDSVRWIQDILKDGVQTNRVDELFDASRDLLSEREIDRKSLSFERAIWITGTP